VNHQRRELIFSIFQHLLAVLGPQNWWPAETAFEVIVGAILTQNTAWKNVEKSIANLRSHGLLTFDSLCHAPIAELAPVLRPSGYYNQKSRKIKAFCDVIEERWQGDLALFLSQDMNLLRSELLSVSGIGPETADSIILYAAAQPSFVVDTYTHRIFMRHGWVADNISYEDLREYFMSCLAPDLKFFQELHALLVRTGHLFCRRKPLCVSCPLSGWNGAG